MEDQRIKISIIIPCFNDVSFIEQAVDSALNQTYKNIEVIVIDDGSNEQTKSVLKKIEYKIKLITQENLGQSTARNVGIKAAKGEFILALDSDDFFEPTFCEKAVSFFNSNDSVKIVTCKSNTIINEIKSSIYTPAGGKLEDFLLSNGSMGSSMFKKSDWREAGGYDEKMRKGFEDWEFYIRLLRSGGNAFVIQEILFNYRQRTDSTTSRANLVRYELLDYIYLKHKDIYQLNFEIVVRHLLSLSLQGEISSRKKVNSLDYKIGNVILKPFRWLKKIIR